MNRAIFFLFFLLGSIGSVAFSEPPPMEKPPQPPARPLAVLPAVKDVIFRVDGKSGETITSTTDSAGCLVKLTFTYHGEGGLPAIDWSPKR